MTPLALLLALVAAPPADADRLSEQAAVLATERRYEEAAALWQRALAADPRHFPSLFNLGFLYFNRGRPADAAPLLERAAALQPADFNTHYVLGSALLGQGRREDALRAWQAALAARPGHFKLMQIMAVEYSNGQYFQAACEIARRAVALQPAALEPHLVAIKACQDAADPSAFELARQALERFPSSARTHFEYGFQLRKAGRREEALPFLKKAMQLDPGYEEPFFFHGDLLLKEEQFAEAEANLRRALSIRPDYVAACVSLAKALLGLDRARDAVAELTACSERSPRHPQPHLLLSQIYFRLGEEERASAEKELSLKLRRDDPTLMESPQARPFPPPPRR